jgi:uncharacterized protein
MLSIGLSCLSISIFKQQDQALAHQSIQRIKYRNLIIDLGNGLKTNAQITYPAVGKGPFPGVLSIQLIIHLFWPVVDRNVFIILPTSAGY